VIEPAREPIVIGMGGNVGTQAEIIERFRLAREAIAELGDVRSAPLYLTAPIGPQQPEFLNTAIRVEIADLQPGELIATLLEIERFLGREREREARWGPRPIDLDVLLWGDRTIRTPELEVPHPRLAERRFALQPLADLFPAAEIPGVGRVAALLERVRDQDLEQLAASW
jgi:2-amino-4-hydroxy-6-hydroxymethyldihydropteridine diphosphokinase